MDVATVYCLGNLTGQSAKNADLIKYFRKNNITAIQGSLDWQFAQSEVTDHLPNLGPKDRDWLLRLPQVLNFSIAAPPASPFTANLFSAARFFRFRTICPGNQHGLRPHPFYAR